MIATHLSLGVEYTLPWLVIADARIDGDGKLRFQLSREDVPDYQTFAFNMMGNTDKEYMVGFRYIISKWFALSTHYDSDMGLGAGITLLIRIWLFFLLIFFFRNFISKQ